MFKKKSLISLVALGATFFTSTAFAAPPSCEIIDVIEIPENNVSNGEIGPGFIISWADVDLGGETNFGAISNYLYVDGELFVNENPTYGVGVEGVWINTSTREDQDGLQSMIIPADVGTHDIEVEISNSDGTGTCASQVTIRESESNPVVRLGKIFVEQLGNNSAELSFAYSVRDYSGDLETVEFVVLEKPFGAIVPDIFVGFYEDGSGAGANGGDNSLTFTTAGDYVLQVYAEDANGEFDYSRIVEFTVESSSPCFTDLNQNHFFAGRAYPFAFQYYGIGTNDALGNAFTETSLRSDFPGFWTLVDSCN